MFSVENMILAELRIRVLGVCNLPRVTLSRTVLLSWISDRTLFRSKMCNYFFGFYISDTGSG
jgi:hypothetical protein